MDRSARRPSGNPATLFWVVTAVAFAIRLTQILLLGDPAVNPAFFVPVTDAGVHHRWAQGLLDGSWPGPAPFFRAPLYPYFLGMLYAVLGSTNPLAVQVVHGAVSAVGAGLAALCARRLWDQPAGWAAGLLFAGLWPSIYFAGELLAVTLSVTLNLLLLWLLLGPPTRRQPLLVGLVLGLSALTRPTVLVVTPVVAWYLWRNGTLGGKGWRRGVIWLALGLAAVIGPVSARNLVRGGEPVLIAASGGVNFYIGNNPWADGRVAFLPGAPPTWQGELDDALALVTAETGRPSTALAADRYFWGRGLAFWRDDPAAALRLTARKLGLLLAAGERSNNKNLAFWRARSPLLRWPIWPGWALVLGLAVLGLGRRDLAPRPRKLLIGLVLSYAVALLLFFINARFRLPVLAWLVVPAGGGAAALLAALRGRRWAAWPRVLPPLALAAGLASFVPDVLTYRPNPTTDFESWRSLGNSFQAYGDPAGAAAAWEQALAADRIAPREAYDWTLPQLYRSLAQMHLQQRRPDLAIGVMRQWSDRLPGDDAAGLGLANLLLAQGQPGAARRHLAVVLARSPDNHEARLGYAWALLHGGEADSALVQFERAGGDGADLRAELGAGLSLVELQAWTAAEPRLKAVLRAQPGLWQAHEGLAELYHGTGRIEAEAAAWTSVLAAQPAHKRARSRLAELRRP